jgi:hypothetical protein
MDFSSSFSQKATFVGLQQETKDYLSGLLSLSLSLSLRDPEILDCWGWDEKRFYFFFW